MKLLQARELAERVRDTLAPFCANLRTVTLRADDDRPAVEIVGSVRRARPEPNDIDLVCLPAPGQLGALKARVLARNTAIKDGEQFLSVRTRDGVQVDIWFAHEGKRDLLTQEASNWGSLVVCRTGSAAHNVYLCQRAKEVGLKWETTRGIVHHLDMGPGKVIASVTEEEIFRVLGMDFVPPVARERE